MFTPPDLLYALGLIIFFWCVGFMVIDSLMCKAINFLRKT